MHWKQQKKLEADDEAAKAKKTKGFHGIKRMALADYFEGLRGAEAGWRDKYLKYEVKVDEDGDEIPGDIIGVTPAGAELMLKELGYLS